MACFIVPAAEAVVTTVAAKIVKKNENKDGTSDSTQIRFSDKLGWLNKMLWGGSGLLAFEHLWHGEIQPFFPFLTAASDAASASAMLNEMATRGTAMAALVTVAWAGLAAFSSIAKKRPKQESGSAEDVRS